MSDKKSKFEVAIEWNKFLKRLFPTNVKLPPMQMVEMKRAFYGGFGQALVIMSEKASELSEDEAITVLKDLFSEVERFWSRQVHYRIAPENN